MNYGVERYKMNRQSVGLLGTCFDTISSGSLPQGATLSNISMSEEGPSYPVEYVADSTTDSFYAVTSLIEKAIDDLDALSKLPIDWDSYGSPKISDDLIMAAKRFLYQLEFEFIAPRVVPVSGGGIQLEWQIGERELELEFTDSENIGYLKVSNEEPIEESQFNRNDFNTGRNTIQWLRGS